MATKIMAEPTLDLPIQYQTLNVDIEPVAQMKQFGAESYDVANWVAAVAVNSPVNQEYTLVIPFAIESGTRATVRIVSSTDDDFRNVKSFSKPKGKVEQFVPYLKKMGVMPEVDNKLTPELRKLASGFKVATLRIPSGQHMLRIHASQKLMPLGGDARSYELAMYAPLCNFTFTNGNLTALLTMPPDFQAPTQVEAPIIEPLPNQPMPAQESMVTLPVQASNNKVYAWHFRNDPKITVRYRYN